MLPELATLSDINECSQAEICGQNSYCNNTDGGFRCTCFTGFKARTSGLAAGSQNPCIGIPSLCRSLTSLWSRRCLQLKHITYSPQMTTNVLLISAVKTETAQTTLGASNAPAIKDTTLPWMRSPSVKVCAILLQRQAVKTCEANFLLACLNFAFLRHR